MHKKPSTKTVQEANSLARPFLKWAGGKSQLLDQIDKYLPLALKEGKIQNYFEPFVGSGAVFFHVIQKYSVRNATLSDFNHELMDIYRVVRDAVDDLISELTVLSDSYHAYLESGREAFFYKVRERYNSELRNSSKADVRRAADAIFLNRTCFNGLFRVNRRGEFNVPHGRYTNPTILNETNLKQVSSVLRSVELLDQPFEHIEEQVPRSTFVYFDPPYRPLSQTSSFTSYSTFNFDDKAQRKLAEVYLSLANKPDVWLMLSNSDTGDGFFEQLYNRPGIIIRRVQAYRMINSDAAGRGKISELLICSYG